MRPRSGQAPLQRRTPSKGRPRFLLTDASQSHCTMLERM